MGVQIIDDYPCTECGRREAVLLETKVSNLETVLYLRCLFDPCGADFSVVPTEGGVK